MLTIFTNCLVLSLWKLPFPQPKEFCRSSLHKKVIKNKIWFLSFLPTLADKQEAQGQENEARDIDRTRGKQRAGHLWWPNGFVSSKEPLNFSSGSRAATCVAERDTSTEQGCFRVIIHHRVPTSVFHTLSKWSSSYSDHKQVETGCRVWKIWFIKTRQKKLM